MNYACAFLGFILLAAMIYWYIRGRHFYNGPITEAIAEDSQSESDAVMSTNKSEKAELPV